VINGIEEKRVHRMGTECMMEWIRAFFFRDEV
jgi:hypothetical protein